MVLTPSGFATGRPPALQADVAERWDLRTSRLVFSIDPKGSEDIDDALSLHRTAAGTLELGVHIADVSAFVRPGSPADLEARARYKKRVAPPSARLMLIHAIVAPVAGGRRCCRGTTVYLADRRFNMLPAVLSEDLCSLRGGQDRFAGTARHPPLQASSAAPCSASSVVTDLRMRGM